VSDADELRREIACSSADEPPRPKCRPRRPLPRHLERGCLRGQDSHCRQPRCRFRAGRPGAMVSLSRSSSAVRSRRPTQVSCSVPSASPRCWASRRTASMSLSWMPRRSCRSEPRPRRRARVCDRRAAAPARKGGMSPARVQAADYHRAFGAVRASADVGSGRCSEIPFAGGRLGAGAVSGSPSSRA
jgi:hypothetical protein